MVSYCTVACKVSRADGGGGKQSRYCFFSFLSLQHWGEKCLKVETLWQMTCRESDRMLHLPADGGIEEDRFTFSEVSLTDGRDYFHVAGALRNNSGSGIHGDAACHPLQCWKEQWAQRLQVNVGIHTKKRGLSSPTMFSLHLGDISIFIFFHRNESQRCETMCPLPWLCINSLNCWAIKTTANEKRSLNLSHLSHDVTE